MWPGRGDHWSRRVFQEDSPGSVVTLLTEVQERWRQMVRVSFSLDTRGKSEKCTLPFLPFQAPFSFNCDCFYSCLPGMMGRFSVTFGQR